MMRDSGWRLIQLHRNRSLRVAFLHHRFNSLPQFPFNSSGRRHWSPPSSILEDKAPLRSKKTILVIIPFKLTRTPNTQFACVTEGWLGLVRDDESGRLITKASAEDGLDLSGIEVVPGERSTLSGFQSMPMAIARSTCSPASAPSSRRLRSALDLPVTSLPRSTFHTEASQLRLTPVPMNSPAKPTTRKWPRNSSNLGSQTVAVTMGSDGALLPTNTSTGHIPPFNFKVVDTTGAGDAFMGGLSYGRLRGLGPPRHRTVANACAAICCTRVGARAVGTLDEVSSLVHAQRPGKAAAF
jgi:pfkB family carbohydrate kinase